MKLKQWIPALAFLLIVSVGGCRKKSVQAPPPPPQATEVAAAPDPVREPVEARQPQPESSPLAPPAEPASSGAGASFSDELARLLRDAHFDYDRYEIRIDARDRLVQNSSILKDLFDRFPDGRIRIEGHADERGSAEYNLALADRRASKAHEFLATMGVAQDRISTVSYGKERPQCSDSHENCWQQNRRVHFESQ